jgi:hypothetical protein
VRKTHSCAKNTREFPNQLFSGELLATILFTESLVSKETLLKIESFCVELEESILVEKGAPGIHKVFCFAGLLSFCFVKKVA